MDDRNWNIALRRARSTLARSRAGTKLVSAPMILCAQQATISHLSQEPNGKFLMKTEVRPVRFINQEGDASLV